MNIPSHEIFMDSKMFYKKKYIFGNTKLFILTISKKNQVKLNWYNLNSLIYLFKKKIRLYSGVPRFRVLTYEFGDAQFSP